MLKDIKLLITVIVLLGIFIISSYLARKYQDELVQYIDSSNIVIELATYLLFTIVATVIAPISNLPLIPILANTWGSFVAGVLTIIGWSVGGLLAFLIAKKYGQPIVSKFASEESLKKIKTILPQRSEHAFWSIVLLRIIVPTDVLSYGLGLFTNVKTRTFFFATLIGEIPAAMIFAYTGTWTIKYQIIILGAGLALILYLLRLWIRIHNPNL
jgi:uncharacterized membrane protein YdjX (TVP38/TMEM64 family)